MNSLEDNYKSISLRVRAAALRCGRDPDEISLLAASKTRGPSDISEAWQAGIRTFGENRVQEIEEKFDPRHQGDIELHMIGHLQSNKVKTAVRLVDWIQSVDREKIIIPMSNCAEEKGRCINICVEVNTSAEDSKFGLRDDDEVLRLCALIQKLPGLELRGLMTIGPLLSEGDRPVRAAFVRLRSLFLRVQENLSPLHWDTLSMGMSNDFEIAIEEGATIIRIGSSLFGERNEFYTSAKQNN